jgi:hypothetical protein
VRSKASSSRSDQQLAYGRNVHLHIRLTNLRHSAKTPELFTPDVGLCRGVNHSEDRTSCVRLAQQMLAPDKVAMDVTAWLDLRLVTLALMRLAIFRFCRRTTSLRYALVAFGTQTVVKVPRLPSL